MVFKGPRQHWLYGQLLLEGKSGLAREGVFGCGQLCMYVPGETRCSVPPAALAVRQRPKILELTSRVVYEQFDGGRFQAAIFC